MTRSNLPTLGGCHSGNSLHTDREFEHFASLIKRAALGISDDLAYDPSYPLQIDSMWAIINAPGSHDSAHIHPGALWSSVYYLHTPEDCGEIEFVNPRISNVMNAAKFDSDRRRPVECWTSVKFTPSAGQLSIFPSWLYHSVHPSFSKLAGRDGERVILSFNLSQAVR
ncbi:TIGR02466 family protein [Litoreibacter roseus]|uniref:TIGR02466 family protein n=1 Tax=Litoreibacter roseus TaxID=2601869 RepID=UPI00135C1DFB